MELNINNLKLLVGKELRVHGEIPADCKRFEIDLGKDSKNFGVHFNPRWDDPEDSTIIALNSYTDGNWDPYEEKVPNTLKRGSSVTIVLKLDDKYNFKIQLPKGQPIQFPNRTGMDIDFFRIRGDFKMTSFQM